MDGKDEKVSGKLEFTSSNNKYLENIVNLISGESSKKSTPKKKDKIEREVNIKINASSEGVLQTEKNIKKVTKAIKELSEASLEIKEKIEFLQNGKRKGKSNLANLWTNDEVLQAKKMTDSIQKYNEQLKLTGELSKETLSAAMEVVKWTNAYKGFGYKMNNDAKSAEKLANSLSKILDNNGKKASEYYNIKDFEEIKGILNGKNRDDIANALSERSELVKIIKSEQTIRKALQKENNLTNKNIQKQNEKQKQEIKKATDSSIKYIQEKLDQAIYQMERNKGETVLGQQQIDAIYKYFYTLEHLLDNKGSKVLAKYQKFVDFIRYGTPSSVTNSIEYSLEPNTNVKTQTKIKQESKKQIKEFLKDVKKNTLNLPELSINDMSLIIEAKKKEQEIILETKKILEEQKNSYINNQKKIQEEIDRTTKAMQKRNEIIKESEKLLNGNTKRIYEISKRKESAYDLYDQMNGNKYTNENKYFVANYLANRSKITDSEDLQKLFRDTASIFYSQYLKSAPKKEQKLINTYAKGNYEPNRTFSNSLYLQGKEFDSILNNSSFYEQKLEEINDKLETAEMVYSKLETKLNNLNKQLLKNPDSINSFSNFEIKKGTTLSSAKKQLQNIKKEKEEINQLLDIYIESITRIRRTVEKGEFSINEIMSTISEKASSGDKNDFDMASIYWGALKKETGKKYSIKNNNNTDITSLLEDRILEIQQKLQTGTENDLDVYNTKIEQLNKYISALKETKRIEKETQEAEMAAKEARRKAQEEAFLQAEKEAKQRKEQEESLNNSKQVEYQKEITEQIKLNNEEIDNLINRYDELEKKTKEMLSAAKGDKNKESYIIKTDDYITANEELKKIVLQLLNNNMILNNSGKWSENFINLDEQYNLLSKFKNNFNKIKLAQQTNGVIQVHSVEELNQVQKRFELLLQVLKENNIEVTKFNRELWLMFDMANSSKLLETLSMLSSSFENNNIVNSIDRFNKLEQSFGITVDQKPQSFKKYDVIEDLEQAIIDSSTDSLTKLEEAKNKQQELITGYRDTITSLKELQSIMVPLLNTGNIGKNTEKINNFVSKIVSQFGINSFDEDNLRSSMIGLASDNVVGEIRDNLRITVFNMLNSITKNLLKDVSLYNSVLPKNTNLAIEEEINNNSSFVNYLFDISKYGISHLYSASEKSGNKDSHLNEQKYYDKISEIEKINSISEENKKQFYVRMDYLLEQYKQNIISIDELLEMIQTNLNFYKIDNNSSNKLHYVFDELEKLQGSMTLSFSSAIKEESNTLGYYEKLTSSAEKYELKLRVIQNLIKDITPGFSIIKTKEGQITDKTIYALAQKFFKGNMYEAREYVSLEDRSDKLNEEINYRLYDIFKKSEKNNLRDNYYTKLQEEIEQSNQEIQQLYNITEQYLNMVSTNESDINHFKSTLEILQLLEDTYLNVLEKIKLLQVPREEYIQSSNDLYNEKNRQHNKANAEYNYLKQPYHGIIENEIEPTLTEWIEEIKNTLTNSKEYLKANLNVRPGPRLKQTPVISEEEFTISQEALEKANQIKQAIGSKNTDTELIAIKVDEILQGADALEKVHEIMQLLSKDSALFSKSSKETWEQWKLVRDYISKSTIKIDSKFKSDLGEDFRTYYNIIGAKNMRVDKGATINEILNDIADSIGVVIPGDKDNPTNALINLVNYLKDGKPNKKNLVSDYLNSFNAEDVIKGIVTGEPAIEELVVVFDVTEKKVENATKKMIASIKELIQAFSKLGSFNDLQGIFGIIDRVDDRGLLNAASNLLSNFGAFSDDQWEQIINRMNNRRNTLPEIASNQSTDNSVKRKLYLKKSLNRPLISDTEVEKFSEEVVEQYVEDFTESANKYFREALLRGTGFENGKKRVFDFFTQDGFKLNSKNTTDFLKKEFGEGGFSGKPNKGYGLSSMNSSASGIDFSWIDKLGTIHNEKRKWNEAAKVISELINEQIYYIKETSNKVEKVQSEAEKKKSSQYSYRKITDPIIEKIENTTVNNNTEKEKTQNQYGQNVHKIPDITHTQWKQDNEDIKEENKLIDTLNRELSDRNRKLVEGTKLIDEETDRVKVLFYYSKSSPEDTVTGGLSGKAFSTVPLTLREDEVMTQWYANINKIYEYGTKFTLQEAQIIVTDYLTGLSQNIQNELIRLLTSGKQEDLDRFFKVTGLSPNSFYIGGLQALGYEAFQKENLLQILDLSKVFKATDLEVIVSAQMDKIFSQFYKITSPESDYRYVEDENGNKIFSEKYQNIGSELAKVGETFTEVVEKGVYKLYEDFEEYERLFGKMRVLRSERTNDGTYKDTYEIMPNYQRTFFNKWEKGENGPELVDYIKDVQTYQQLEEQAISVTKELIKVTADLNIEQSKGASTDQNKIKSLTSLIGYYKKTRNEIDLIATLMSQQTGSDFTIGQYTEAIKKGTEKQLLSSQGKVSIQTERFKKEIQTVYDSYFSKLEQFKSTNKDIERFLADPIQNMEASLYGLLYGKVSIIEVKKAFKDLSSAASEVNASFPAQLSKSAAAYKAMTDGPSNILKLRREFEELGDIALDTEEKLQKLESTLIDLKKSYRNNNGLEYTSLSRKYKEDLEQLKNELKIQKQARKDFNDLEEQVTSRIDSTKDFGSLKIDEDLNKAKNSLDSLLNDFLLGNITIDEYIQKLKEFKNTLNNTFSSIEPIEQLYISIRNTKDEISSFSTQINILYAKIADAERLGKDTTVFNYQLEQLNSKLKEAKEKLTNIYSEIQKLQSQSTISIGERDSFVNLINGAYNTTGTNESQLKKDSAEQELNLNKVTNAYKLYIDQLQKVYDLEYSNTLFTDTTKIDLEKEKLDKLREKYEEVAKSVSGFSNQEINQNFVSKNIENLKKQLEEYIKYILKFAKSEEEVKNLRQNLQPTFDLVTNLEYQFSNTGNIESFITNLKSVKETVNEITTGISKQNWNSFSQMNSMLNSMEKLQFSANKVNIFKRSVEELRQQFNNLFSNWSGSQEQIDMLKELSEKIADLRTNANLYKKENAKGIFIEDNTSGKIKDMEDLKAAFTNYLSSYKNVKIAEDPKNVNGLIGTYTDLDGKIKQVKASYDNYTHSMRIGSTQLSNQHSILKNYISGLSNLGKSYISHYLSGYMLVMRMISAFKEGVNSLKEYDKALTTISYTMDISSTKLNELGEDARKLAEELSISVSNAMEIYQIYANMKTSAEEIEKIAKPTAILSNLAGIDASTAADEIQGVINQFKMSSDEAMHIADVYDYISSQIAVDYSKGIKDIAEAVGNVGNVAYGAGLSFEQLSAIIATTAEQTRQEGSQIGNALKTIMVRLSKASSMSDEVDTSTLSNASKALHSIGIEVYTTTGEFREFDIIMNELSDKWDSLSEAQQQNISYQIAATRQTATLKAILDNWSISTQLATEATEANGNALKNQEKYEQSYAGKLQDTKNQIHEFWLNLLNSDSFSSLINILNDFLKAINKLPPVLVAVSTIGLIHLLRIKEGSILLISLIKETYSHIKALVAETVAETAKINAELADAAAIEGVTIAEIGEVSVLKILTAKIIENTKQRLLNIAALIKSHPAITAFIVISTALVTAINLANKAEKERQEEIEKTKEKVNDLISSEKEAINTANSHKETVDDIAKKFDKLSKGVNNLGQNINLSTSEFEEYNSIVNKIADMFPSLISGWTNEGNAIINLTDNVNNLSEAYKEEREEAYKTLIATGKNSNGDSIIQNWKNILGPSSKSSIAKEKIKIIESVLQSSSEKEALNLIFGENSQISLSADEKSKVLKEVFGITVESVSTVSAQGHKIEYGFANYPTDISSYQMLAKSYIDTYRSIYESEMSQGLNSIKEMAYAYLFTGDNLKQYEKLTPEAQNSMSILIGSLTEETAKYFDSQIEVDQWVSNLLNKISSSIDENGNLILDEITSLFSLDLKNMPVEESSKIITSYVKSIASELGYTDEEFLKIFGLDKYVDLKERINNSIDNLLKDEDLSTRISKKGSLYAYLKNLSYEEGELWLEYVSQLEEGTTSTYELWDNFQKFLSQNYSSTSFSLSNWLKSLSDYTSSSSNSSSKSYFSWSDAIDKYKSEINDLKTILDDTSVDSSEMYGKLVSNFAGSSLINQFDIDIEKYLQKYPNDYKKAIKEFILALQKAFISAINSSGNIENIDSILNSIGLSTSTAIGDFTFAINNNTLEDVQKFVNGLEKLDSIYLDIKNKEDFDWSSVLNNTDFDETYKGLDSYDSFIETVTKYPKDLKKCQDAFNQLSTEYLRNSKVLNNVDASTREATISMLKQYGVSNAQIIVDEVLAYKEEQLALNKQFLAENGKEVTDASYDEIVAFLEEKGASEVASQAMYELALQKAVLNNEKLDLSSDINQILNLAKAAKVSSEYLNALNKLNSLKNKYGEIVPTDWKDARSLGMSQNDWDEYQRAYSLLNKGYDWTDVDFQIDFDSSIKYNGGPSTKSSSSNSEDYFDFIEIAINRLEREITNLGKVTDATYKGWEERSTSLLSEISKVTDEISLQQSAYNSYMKMANSVGLSETYKKLIQNGGLRIEDIQDETLKNNIKNYQSWYEKALACSDAIEDLKGNLADLAQKDFDLISARYEAKLTEASNMIDFINGKMDIIESRNQIVGKSFYEALISQEQAKMKELEAEYVSLSNSLANAVNSGAIEYGSQQWYDMKNSIMSVEKEINNSENQILQYGEEIKNVITNIFDYLEGRYSSLIGLLENRNKITQSLISLIETTGHIADSSYYKAEMEVLQAQLESKQLELKALQDTLDQGLRANDIEKYDEKWIEMTGTIENTLVEITDLNQQLIEMDNNIRQLSWDIFDRIQNSFSDMINEASFLKDIMNYDSLYDDYGSYNDRGLATQGLIVSNYQMYVKKVKEYASEIQKINEQLANDPNNTTLIDRQKELVSAQQEAISSAKSEKEAIKSLTEEGYNILLNKLNDLISKYEESLDAQKDLYDYEKNIKEQTINIGNLQKQIMAYQGDNSEETRATMQKLAKDLKDAQEQLEETQYDQWKKDQQTMLSNMTDDLKEWINARLDNIEGLLNEAIQNVEKNSSVISETISLESLKVGYTLTDNFESLIQNGITNMEVLNEVKQEILNLPTTLQELVNSEYYKNLSTTISSVNNGVINLGTNLSNLQNTLSNYFSTNGGLTTYFGSNTIQSIIDAINNLKAQVVESGNAIVSMRQAQATASAVSQNTSSSSSSGGSSGGGSNSSSNTTTKPAATPTNTQKTTTSYITKSASSQAEIDRYAYELRKSYDSVSVNRVYTDSYGRPTSVQFKVTKVYAKGTTNAKKGINLVGEQGRELYIDNQGNVSLIEEPSFIKMNGGETVLNNKDTERILQNSNYLSYKFPDNMQSFINSISLDKINPLDNSNSSIKKLSPKSDVAINQTSVGDISINLPNVTNKEQFVSWLKTDGQINKIIQTMTIGQAIGNNKYNHRSM